MPFYLGWVIGCASNKEAVGNLPAQHLDHSVKKLGLVHEVNNQAEPILIVVNISTFFFLLMFTYIRIE